MTTATTDLHVRARPDPAGSVLELRLPGGHTLSLRFRGQETRKR